MTIMTPGDGDFTDMPTAANDTCATSDAEFLDLREPAARPPADPDLLFKNALGMDAEAASRLVLKVALSLYQGNAHDARDLANDVMLKVCQRAAKGPVQAVPDIPAAYVTRMTTNQWKDRLKADRQVSGQRIVSLDAQPIDLRDESQGPEDLTVAVVVAEEYRRAIDQLPGPLRAAMNLLVDGHTPAEAAALLGIPISTYKSRLKAAAKEFRSILRRDGGTP